jgi:hypothetical protein
MNTLITSDSLIKQTQKIDDAQWKLVKPHMPERNEYGQEVLSVELHSGNPTTKPAFRLNFNKNTNKISHVELLKGLNDGEFIIVGAQADEVLKKILDARPELISDLSSEQTLSDLKHPKDI